MRGIIVGTADATLCELVAMFGWDFLMADAEHGSVLAADMAGIARACERRAAVALARVPLGAPADVGRFLDAGANGVMAPFVQTPQEAARFVELVKYPPRGRRGVAGTRSLDFGLGGGLAERTAQANRDTLVIAQIESLPGLDQVEAIAAVNGVDIVFVGPTDLSQALGAPLQWEARAFIDAIDRIAAAAAGAGKVFGAYAGSRERMQWYEARGARFTAASLEDLLRLGSAHLRE